VPTPRPVLSIDCRDCCEHATEFLDALNALEFDPWTPVDAPWTPKQWVGVGSENENDG
jgi:hypothetical protein